MSDREAAGLRGPVAVCEAEQLEGHIVTRESFRRDGKWTERWSYLYVKIWGRGALRSSSSTCSSASYRYFDCTEEAEFLYACVRHTVEEDLPREIEVLRRNDEAIRRIMDAVEMPDRVAENLAVFIRQNNGTLSKKRREGEFQKLGDDEVTSV